MQEGSGNGKRRGRAGPAVQPGASSRWNETTVEAIELEVRLSVESVVRDLLGAEASEQLDCSASLMEAGLDSLGATQLVRDLSGKLELDLGPTLLFDFPTIDTLVAHLVGLVVTIAQFDIPLTGLASQIPPAVIPPPTRSTLPNRPANILLPSSFSSSKELPAMENCVTPRGAPTTSVLTPSPKKKKFSQLTSISLKILNDC